jgi:FKBP-type peptidyl-prolyl cis-trans isomerase
MKFCFGFCSVLCSAVLSLGSVSTFADEAAPPAAEAPAAAKAKAPKQAQSVAKKIKKSGMEYTVNHPGRAKGKVAKANQPVSVHYDGRLENGTVFDSSRKRGEPFTFLLGAKQVIAGWDVGVEGMKEGEKRTLYIPANMGYGDRGVPGVIPPNSPLIFDVELLEAKGN